MKTLTSALVLTTLAASAQAQGVESNNITFEVYNYDEGDNIDATFATVLGDTSILLAPAAGLQIGLAGSTQLDASQDFLEEDTEYSLALHGFYDVNLAIRLGLLLGVDTYNDVDFLAAVEGIYVAGPVRAEARFGSYESDVEPADLIEVEGAYAITPQFSATLSYQRLNYEGGNGHFDLAALGGAFAFSETASVFASYGSTSLDFGDGDEFDGDQITIGVNVAIGGPSDPKLFTFNPFF